MIEELQSASSLLGAALERYLAACSMITSDYDPNNPLSHISRVISDLIPSEIDLIASYEAKLKQAKLIIRQTRNGIPAISPITILPPDILIHIFGLVLDSQPCYFEDPGACIAFPLKYPDVLSHVCSHWRQLAIHSPTLWSHIDLIPFDSHRLGKHVFSRTETLFARAGHTPLDIHIIGQTNDSAPDAAADITLNVLCATIATRTRSLKISAPQAFGDFHISALINLLANCTGTLDQIVLTRDGPSDSYELIEPLDASAHPDIPLLDRSHKRLEDSLLPVKFLRLNGVYFHWTSQVYHGLAELQILPQRVKPLIPESLLAGILNGSPRLRALHLGIDIIDLLPHTAPRVAARLDDLKVLNLRQTDCEQYAVLLRLLSPGSKPLQLSVYFPRARFPLLFSDEIAKFINRSNVAELYIQSSDDRPLPLLELFGLLQLPGLRTLSLDNFYLEERRSIHLQDYEASHTLGGNKPESLTISELSALNVIHCRVDLDHLEKVVESLPIHTLRIFRCLVCSEEGGYFKAEECEQRIAKIVSALQLLSAPLEVGN